LARPRTYYYLSRFLFAFLLITLFLALLAFLCTAVAAALVPHRRRRRHVASSFAAAAAATATAALFSMCFSASVFTACFVMAQQAFRADGRSARIGVKATAFVWLCVALLAVCTVALALAMLMGRTMEGRAIDATTADRDVGGKGRRKRKVFFRGDGEKAAATKPDGGEYVNRDSCVSASESQRWMVAGTTA
jgi:hypothetical protein